MKVVITIERAPSSRVWLWEMRKTDGWSRKYGSFIIPRDGVKVVSFRSCASESAALTSCRRFASLHGMDIVGRIRTDDEVKKGTSQLL